ncbi:hypothetical protein Q9L42_007270 [Methylomarinum sp. Ch1-1]|uniref:Uncharacterized protein n=1 Tax=Methylomarinum roseum TaxID=3067653 RepID=A0AAU7NY10_9GAMM|nr:hypothetical protein [Methylomarinum sp. Ch1-1]MDP4521982.1 hypothetical protein [Methylomarinum sp. Ch1-1]
MRNVRFLSAPAKTTFEMPCDWEEGALKDYLQRLVNIELEGAGEKLCGIVWRLNQSELPSELRLRLLETLDVYLKLYESRVESIYLDASLPLSERKQRCVEWLVWSYSALAQGFQQAAKENETKTIAFLIYRALHCLSRNYLHVSALYYEPADGFWLSVYRLYAAAENAGLLDMTLHSEDMEKATIRQLFQLMMVLHLSDLQQFSSRQIHQLYRFLGPFVTAMPISEQFNGGQFKGIYAIDLSKDRAPLGLAKLPERASTSACRFFMPSGVAKMIYRQIQQGGGQSGLFRNVSKALIVRLVKTLGQAQSRRFKRVEDGRQSRGIIGFANIRDYLLQEQGRDKSVQNRISAEEASKLALVNEEEEQIYHVSTNLKRKFGGDERMQKILAASGGVASKIKVWDRDEPDESDALVVVDDFTVLNSSATGYGLVVEAEQAKVRVGELFAVIAEEGKRLELAVVRWVRRLTGNRLNVGVELIGVANDVVSMFASGRQPKQTKAIFLPGLQALKQADSLIYSAAGFHAGDFVTINKTGRELPCRLNKLINATSAFNQSELFYLKTDEQD